MIDRRLFLQLSAVTVSCARAGKSLREILPNQVQRAWILKRTETLPAEEAPAVVRSLGMKQGINAIYEGNGSISVRLFEMTAEASAFELIQKWRQHDGLAMYKGRYFFVAVPVGPDQATVSAFLQAFQKELRTA
jgi:hypothetical protein